MINFANRCIKNGITSKDIRNDTSLQGNVLADMLSNSLEEYEKSELRKNKLNKICQKLKKC